MAKYSANYFKKNIEVLRFYLSGDKYKKKCGYAAFNL